MGTGWREERESVATWAGLAGPRWRSGPSIRVPKFEGLPGPAEREGTASADASSLVLGAYPTLGAAAILLFFVVTTPTTQDFWNAEGSEEQQTEMTGFLENAPLSGGALVLFGIGAAAWPYSLGLGV